MNYFKIIIYFFLTTIFVSCDEESESFDLNKVNYKVFNFHSNKAIQIQNNYILLNNSEILIVNNDFNVINRKKISTIFDSTNFVIEVDIFSTTGNNMVLYCLQKQSNADSTIKCTVKTSLLNNNLDVIWKNSYIISNNIINDTVRQNNVSTLPVSEIFSKPTGNDNLNFIFSYRQKISNVLSDNILFLKYNINGGLSKYKIISASSLDNTPSIIQLTNSICNSDDEILLTSIIDFMPRSKTIIAKFDKDFNLLWKQYCFINSHYSFHPYLKQVDNNNYIMIGSVISPATNNIFSVYYAEINNSNVKEILIDNKENIDNKINEIVSSVSDCYNDILICGFVGGNYNFSTSSKILLQKINKDKTVVWHSNLDDMKPAQAIFVSSSTDSTITLIGNKMAFEDNNNIQTFFLKLKPNGKMN